MTARVYSTWNPNALGDGLVLDQGNLVVTTGQDSLSNARKVLATLPKSSASGFYETVFWSTPQVSLSTNVATGVALTDSPLNEAVGHDEQRVFGQESVLIRLTSPTDIGHRRPGQVDGSTGQWNRSRSCAHVGHAVSSRGGGGPPRASATFTY